MPGGSSSLEWTATNATSCAASGAWSGTKAVTGKLSTGALNATASYQLACTGAGGSVTRSLTITVSASAKPPYFEHTSPTDDAYLNNLPQWADWYKAHHSRLIVFSPFFDNKLSWFPDALAYFDLYAIYATSDIATTHPDWILKDAQGNRLYIPWACGGGTCPQYAADVANPAFRDWWIAQAKTLVTSRGYRGLWIDDVNLDFRVGDGNGAFVAPVDTRIGGAMTEDNWRKYMVEFLEAIRAALPSAEIIHNSVWYAGGTARQDNPWVRRQILAANYANLEHAFRDGGLTGGTGIWSVNALRGYVDAVHALGRKVIVGSVIDGTPSTPAELEYSLANYFLVTTGTDGLGHQTGATPANWWTPNETDLGAPSGPRYTWQGLARRDFARGMVLVNDPGAATVTVTLPSSFITVDGRTVTQVSITGKQGVVLRK